MGNNVSSGEPLSGLLIPWPVTIDVAPGDDPVTVADARPGRAVPESATTCALELACVPGTTMDAALESIDLGVTSPGVTANGALLDTPGPFGAGVAYRPSDTATWMGRDTPVALTGVQRVSSSTTARRPSIVTLPSGVMVLCYSTSTATQVQTRTVGGVWGSAVTVHSTTHELACIAVAADGSLMVYSSGVLPGGSDHAIRAYRSTDDGATWTLQSYNVGAGQGPSSIGKRIRCAVTNGGTFVLFSTTSINECEQYVSSDGGVTFKSVAQAGDTTCWDVRNNGGQMVALFTEDDGTGTDRLYSRVLASPAADAWTTERVLVSSGGSHSRAASLAYDVGSGIAYVMQDSSSSYAMNGFRQSAITGAWGAFAPGWNAAVTAGGWDGPTMAFARGVLVVVGRTDGNGGGAVALWEFRYGGNTNATIGSQLGENGFAGGTQFAPIGTLANAGWPTSDTGAPTRTLSATTGQRIQTGAGDSAVHDSPNFTSADVGVFRYVVRVASGQVFLRCISNGCAIEIQINSTQIRAYDQTVGPSGTYATHGATDYLEVLAIVDPSTSTAHVSYRAVDVTPSGSDDITERVFTSWGNLSGLGAVGADVRAKITVSASSDVYVYEAHLTAIGSTTLSDGWARPTELDPVSLSVSFAYLGRGLDVAMTGGVAMVDGVVFTSTRTSAYRVENVIPQVAASPSAVWRSADTTTDETITLLLDHPDAPGVVGVYLDGLVGVSEVVVTAGLPATVLSLGTAFAYDRTGGVIVPTGTGSVTGKPYVRADELRGWYLADSGGGVAKITGNSEGSLTYGSTIAQHRAVLYVDDGLVTTGTNISGTLYPSRALLLGRLESGDTIASVTLSIVAADQFTPPEGYREIGVAAVGRVHVFGIAPDLNDTLSMQSNADYQTIENGQRYSGRRAPDRRVVEIAFVGSPHEARAMFGTSTSPDYVVARTGGVPVASRTGIPLVVEGIVRRAANVSDGLVVWCPRITADTADTWTGSAFGLDATVYGRITSEFRREAIQYVGERGATQIFRVPQIRIEEEL